MRTYTHTLTKKVRITHGVHELESSLTLLITHTLACKHSLTLTHTHTHYSLTAQTEGRFRELIRNPLKAGLDTCHRQRQRRRRRRRHSQTTDVERRGTERATDNQTTDAP